MKLLVGVDAGSYTFNAATKQVTLLGLTTLALEQVLLITNVTRQEIIYQFNSTSKGATIAANVLTLEYDTTAHDNADSLQIFIDIDLVQTSQTGSSSALAPSVSADLVTVAVAANKTPRLKGIIVSSDRACTFALTVNAVTVFTLRTFTDTPCVVFTPEGSYKFPASATVKIVGTNVSDQGTAALEATIFYEQ